MKELFEDSVGIFPFSWTRLRVQEALRTIRGLSWTVHYLYFQLPEGEVLQDLNREYINL